MTLTEIEKALAAIEAGKREYEAVTGSVYINGEWEAEFATEAEAQFYILAPEYVRTLLAIAQAAREWAKMGYEDRDFSHDEIQMLVYNLEESVRKLD